jgi:MSHA pilin protein MshD
MWTCSRRAFPAAQRGVNLVELLIAIVIISIASTGVLLVYAQVVGHSADPMIQQQALAVAEAYLDEILARPVDDPDAPELGGPGTPEEAARSQFDDVKDYWGLAESPPRNQNGVAEDVDLDGNPDLGGYTVTVDVTPNVNVGGVAMARVDVTVTYPPVVSFTLTGYRGND